MTDFTTWTQQNLARLASDLWTQNVSLRQQLDTLSKANSLTSAAGAADSTTKQSTTGGCHGLVAHKAV